MPCYFTDGIICSSTQWFSGCWTVSSTVQKSLLTLWHPCKHTNQQHHTQSKSGYQKTSSSTSWGSGAGLNTINKRSLDLLSGGASFFRDGRLTSVWIRGVGGAAVKAWGKTASRRRHRNLQAAGDKQSDAAVKFLTEGLSTWLLDGLFHIVDIIWVATNCMAIRPTELQHGWQ